MPTNKLYQLTVRDSNGKVIQIHELYYDAAVTMILAEASKGYRVTIKEL